MKRNEIAPTVIVLRVGTSGLDAEAVIYSPNPGNVLASHNHSPMGVLASDDATKRHRAVFHADVEADRLRAKNPNW